MKLRRSLIGLMLIVAALMLGACDGGRANGNGSGGDNTTSAAAGSNWDEMKWDQGTWK